MTRAAVEVLTVLPVMNELLLLLLGVGVAYGEARYLGTCKKRECYMYHVPAYRLSRAWINVRTVQPENG